MQRDLVTVLPGGADLVARRGRPAARAGDAHAFGARGGDLHGTEIAHHVGQHVIGRVADLVEHLLCDRRGGDQAAGIVGLGKHEAAVARHFGDREAHVVVVRHQPPIGEIAAVALRAAFDDVAAQRAGGKAIEFLRRPGKGMDQRTQRHRRIDAAAGDDDVGHAVAPAAAPHLGRLGGVGQGALRVDRRLRHHTRRPPERSLLWNSSVHAGRRAWRIPRGDTG